MFTFPQSRAFFKEECFSAFKSFSSVTLELWSRLSRIEERAFAETGLIEIVILALVEILD
jgi:hypothetical protein